MILKNTKYNVFSQERHQKSNYKWIWIHNDHRNSSGTIWSQLEMCLKACTTKYTSKFRCISIYKDFADFENYWIFISIYKFIYTNAPL